MRGGGGEDSSLAGWRSVNLRLNIIRSGIAQQLIAISLALSHLVQLSLHVHPFPNEFFCSHFSPLVSSPPIFFNFKCHFTSLYSYYFLSKSYFLPSNLILLLQISFLAILSHSLPLQSCFLFLFSDFHLSRSLYLSPIFFCPFPPPPTPL